MALGVLNILYIVLLIIGITIQVLLYTSKNKSKNNIFISNLVFALILSYLVYTSLPTNYTDQKVLAIMLGGISIIGFFINLYAKKLLILSKIMISLSIIGSFTMLFL